MAAAAEVQAATLDEFSQPRPIEHVTMPAAAEVQAATLDKFLKDWSKWTVEDFVSTWSKDFTQRRLPLSAGGPAYPRAHLEQEMFPSLMSTVSNLKASQHSGLPKN